MYFSKEEKRPGEACLGLERSGNLTSKKVGAIPHPVLMREGLLFSLNSIIRTAERGSGVCANADCRGLYERKSACLLLGVLM